MAELQQVPVALLVPPDKPMRSETLYDDLDELKESLATHGLQQPIGVHRTSDDTYQIIWGMRRALAVRELGWETIAGFVYQPGEGDVELLMAHENFHRTQLDPVEEAEFFARMMDTHKISQAEVARRCRKSVTTVSVALQILEGDPDVLEALRRGLINKAQAREINAFVDELGRKQALNYAKSGGMTAHYLHRWREERERDGISKSMENVQEVLANLPPSVDLATLSKCHLHNEFVPIQETLMVVMCRDCQALMLEGLEIIAERQKGAAS